MKDFTGKVAVVTGAASGIGRAIAQRCAREGMRLVLADIEQAPLSEAAEELQAEGVVVLSVVTDVSKWESVLNLADRAYDRFGAVDLLFNNAGVGGGVALWECALEDWKWVLGVNLWGVIHGVKAFVPRMIAQDSECVVVNTASIAGLITAPGLGIYTVSKHAVVALSESLYHDLQERGAQVKVAVVCPAYVKTRIMESARNRQEEYWVTGAEAKLPESLEARRQALENGIPPERVAECVFDALQEEHFYIFTHPEWTPLVQARMQDITSGQSPVSPLARSLALAQGQGAIRPHPTLVPYANRYGNPGRGK